MQQFLNLKLPQNYIVLVKCTLLEPSLSSAGLAKVDEIINSLTLGMWSQAMSHIGHAVCGQLENGRATGRGAHVLRSYACDGGKTFKK